MPVTLSHAIILAAGLGKRMQPLTLTRPKPLVEVLQKPLIDYNIEWLTRAGIGYAVVNTSYMADMLEEHLQHTKHMNITISREEPEPLETGGGIFNALHHLGSTPFVSMNSDAIFPSTSSHPLNDLGDHWQDKTMDFLMLLVPKNRAHGLHGKADFMREADGRVRRPTNSEEAEYIFTGVQLIHPRVFAKCSGGAFSVSKLWQAEGLDDDGCYLRVNSLVLDGDWLHVGDLKGLAEAEEYMRSLTATAEHPAAVQTVRV